MTDVSNKQAAEIIQQHEKLIAEFMQMFDEEDTAFTEWERYINKPLAYLALASAMQYWGDGHEDHVALIFMKVLTSAYNIMRFQDERAEEMKTALGWYGNEVHYEITHDPNNGAASTSVVNLDKGEKARKVLKGQI